MVCLKLFNCWVYLLTTLGKLKILTSLPSYVFLLLFCFSHTSLSEIITERRSLRLLDFYSEDKWNLLFDALFMYNKRSIYLPPTKNIKLYFENISQNRIIVVFFIDEKELQDIFIHKNLRFHLLFCDSSFSVLFVRVAVFSSRVFEHR